MTHTFNRVRKKAAENQFKLGEGKYRPLCKRYDCSVNGRGYGRCYAEGCSMPQGVQYSKKVWEQQTECGCIY